MKYSGVTRCLLQIMICFFCIITLLQADESNHQSNAQIMSDVKVDCTAEHLSVVSGAISLKWLFKEIANQCNIDVQFDEDAEDTISVNVVSLELEKSVKHILKGRNYILSYGKNNQQQLAMSGVIVLPDGDEQLRGKNNGADDEQYNRMISQLSLEQARQIEAQTKRWQVHLESMPSERRSAMEKRIADRIINNVKRKQKHEKYQQTRQQRRAERRAKQQQALELKRQNMTEEERALFDERRLKSNEQLGNQLRSQLNNNSY